MNPDTERKIEEFLAQATIGLEEDPILRAEATDELRSHLEARITEAVEEGLDETAAFESATQEFGSPAAMATNLVSANAPKLKARARASFFLRRILVPASILVAIFVGFQELRRFATLDSLVQLKNGGSGGLFSGSIENRHGSSLTEEEKLLLFGTITSGDEEYSARSLWESAPKNPAYYASYLLSLINDNQPLPADMIALGDEIDPGNAFYRILAASEAINNTLDEVSDETPPSSLNHAKLGAEIASLKDIEGMPRYARYHLQLLRERFAILPEPRSRLEQTNHLVMAASISLPELSRTQNLAKAIKLQAEYLIGENDAEGLGELTEIWLEVTRLFSSDIDFLLDGLVAVSIVEKPGEILLAGCEQLGLTDTAARVATLTNEVNNFHENWKSEKYKDSKDFATFKQHAGVIVGVSVPAIGGSAPLPGEQHLRPGRMVDYITIERAAVTILIVVFLVAMGLYAAAGLKSGREETSIIFLLRAKDYAIVLGLGVVAPLLFYLILTRLTPFGGHGVAVNWEFPVWALQLWSLAFLSVFAVGQLVIWRLGLPSTKWRKAPVAAAVSLIVIASGITLFPNSGALQIAATVVAAITVVLAVVAGCVWWKQIFFNQPASLPRAFVPVCGATILIVATTIPLLNSSERSWIGRDTIILPEGGLGFTSIELEVTREFREALIAATADAE